MRIPIETALGYLKAGLSCLPAVRAKKHPATGSWKKWAKALPTQIEVECWFANAHDAICIVAGAVSGNLECLDFDNHGELFEAWKARVDPETYSRLVVERTPSGGCHVLYRSGKPVDGNLKLARGERDGKTLTLIETRGEGGLFLCAPSEGYELLQGDFAHIPLIKASAREGLLNAARALDELPAANEPSVPLLADTGRSGGFLERPGDDFASRGDPRPYLQAAGWQFCGTAPDGNEQWTRPGKDPRVGFSATLKDRIFYVFSSNAAPFEAQKGYNAFQVYAILEHRGDFTAAARTLLERGYGRRDEAAASAVDFSGINRLLAEGVQAPSPPAASEPEDVPIGELVAAYPKMRPVLIDGFLRLGETMNVIAPPKTGKSWLVTDLALSVAMGTDWFGYQCERGRVLIIDNELHRETTASRIPKIIAARGFDLAEVSPWLSVANQRGRLKTIEEIGSHIEDYREKGYKLIIIDAFYRAMPRGIDENDNGAIADVYNMLDRFAQEIGCAFVLIHHTSKGNQAQKAVTDVGAGAGSQSRAADTHLVLRRHKEKDVVVMDSVVRSFRAGGPVCLRWTWPVWNRDDTLSPDDLDGKLETKGTKKGVDAALENEEILRDIRKIVRPEKPLSKSLFANEIVKRTGVTHTRARVLLEDAIDLGYLKAERLPGQRQGQRSTLFVLLGDVDPKIEEGRFGEDDEEAWREED